MMSDMHSRLRSAREKAGFSSAAAAARSRGWNEATYRHHENGTRRISRDYAEAYGIAFDVSPAWLLGLAVAPDRSLEERITTMMRSFEGYTGELGEVDKYLRENLGLCFVRLVTMEMINKFGDAAMFTAEDMERVFPVELLASLANIKPSDLIAVPSVSSEMAPTIIPGALLLVDVGNREPTEHDQIWLFSYGGLSAIRRLRFRSTDKAVALGDAGSSAPMEIDAHDPSFSIHGRVVWIGQSV